MASYATTTDLANYGLSAAALGNIPNGAQVAALQSASDEADGYLRAQFTLPLLSWTTDLTAKVCQIAAATLIVQRGFNPEGADQAYIDNAETARRWLRDVAMQKTTPGFVDSSSGSSPGITSATGPKVFSRPSRGFHRNPPRVGGGYGNNSGSWGGW